MGQEVANVYDIVEHQEQAFSASLCDNSIKWAQECQFAVQFLQKNKYLNDSAWRNQDSLKNAIINVASIGISLNPALKHAYLVPRDGGVHLDVSYIGLMHLAISGGLVEWGQAKIVYSNDTYTNNGLDKQPAHSYSAFGDRGEAVGVFCTVKLTDGSYLTEEMSREEVHAIRERSMAYKKNSGPWVTDEMEMWRKTVVKRASKYWPKGDGRIDRAIDTINQHEGIDFDAEQSQEDPDKALFHELVNSEDAVELVLLIREVGESRYTNLYNSGEKGSKVKFKDAVGTLERTGNLAINEIIEYINEGEDYKFKETIEEMSKRARTYLFKNELTELQREVVKTWYEKED